MSVLVHNVLVHSVLIIQVTILVVMVAWIHRGSLSIISILNEMRSDVGYVRRFVIRIERAQSTGSSDHSPCCSPFLQTSQPGESERPAPAGE